MCLESLSSCFCASLLYLMCPLKKPQSFALLSLQLLSSTSTLALYTTDCTGTFGPLSDWPRIALGPLHAVFNNTKQGPLRYVVIFGGPPRVLGRALRHLSTGAPRLSCSMTMPICQRGSLSRKTYEASLSTINTMVENGRTPKRLCLGWNGLEKP